jgi:hypothetical protein
MNIKMKKYIQWAFPLVVFLVSLKAILFTWDLIRAGYHYRTDKQQAAVHMYAFLLDKPSVYKAFRETNAQALDNLVLKTAIYNNNINCMKEVGLEPADISRLTLTFKDNFYLHHLLTNPGKREGNWQNLDTVSIEILADHTMNSLTISILEQLSPVFPPGFIENLVDFCAWKKNIELRDYLVQTFALKPNESPVKRKKDPLPGGVGFQESIHQLMDILRREYKLEASDIGKNLVKCPAFDSINTFEKHWFFSKMAGYEPFSDGSFTMGLDRMDTNNVLRMMGFFVHNQVGKSRARGGAWSREKISIQKGFYLFSFDYLTKTGQEAFSFFLCKGIPESYLPPSRGKWKKVTYILNNASHTYPFLRPLLRMWGTGTVLIDNVYLARITNPGFSIPFPGTRTIIGSGSSGVLE